MVTVFKPGVCLSVAFLFINLWQYCVCCIKSGVTRCTLFMVLYLDHVWKCGLQAVLWSHIVIHMRLLSGPLFPSQYPCGTILLTLYSMVWDWRVSRAGQMLVYLPKLLYPFWSSTIFPFLVFLSTLVLWGWGFWLLGCRSLSPSLSPRRLLIIIVIIIFDDAYILHFVSAITP